MVIKELLKKAAMTLKESETDTAALDASVILEFVLKCDRTQLIIDSNKEISYDIEKQYMNLIDKRKNNMPVSYITNKREFMSLDFVVNENVLIPRPDTEELVMHVINSDAAKNSVLDLCCGSGCIGISIAHYCDVKRVDFADISDGALKVAKLNAKNILDKECKSSFLNIDVLNQTIDKKYDIIASNPPYVRRDIIKDLDKTVSCYEPHIALDGGEDGLDFYKRIVFYYKDNLKANGMLAFEVGFNQAQAVCDMMKENSFKDIQTAYDLGGICRVVSGRV